MALADEIASISRRLSLLVGLSPFGLTSAGSKVLGVRVSKSFDSPVPVATITVDTIHASVKRGDRVIIEVGYNGLRERIFTGYVIDRAYGTTSSDINCAGQLYQLSRMNSLTEADLSVDALTVKGAIDKIFTMAGAPGAFVGVDTSLVPTTFTFGTPTDYVPILPPGSFMGMLQALMDVEGCVVKENGTGGIKVYPSNGLPSAGEVTDTNLIYTTDAVAGTATSATTGPPGTLTDTTAAWVVDEFVGATITAGGKTITVASNTATVITGTGGWSGGSNPGAVAYVGTKTPTARIIEGRSREDPDYLRTRIHATGATLPSGGGLTDETLRITATLVGGLDLVQPPFAVADTYIDMEWSNHLIDTQAKLNTRAIEVLGQYARVPRQLPLEAPGNPLIETGMTVSVQNSYIGESVRANWFVYGIEHIIDISGGGGYATNLDLRGGDEFGGEILLNPDACFSYTVEREVFGTQVYAFLHLNAACSRANNGSGIASYAWSGNQDAADDPAIDSQTTAEFVIRLDPTAMTGDVDNIIVTLTVTDGEGLTGTVTQTIPINASHSFVTLPAVFAALDNNFSATPDGGQNWNDDTTNATNVTTVAAAPPDGVHSGIAVFGRTDGTIYRTTDYCASDLTLVLTAASGSPIVDIAWDTNDAAKVWALQEDLNLYVSLNMGETWVLIADLSTLITDLEEVMPFTRNATTNVESDGILSLDAAGFTVKLATTSAGKTNVNAKTYYWYAFGGDNCVTGSYVGNGAATQAITGIGGTPVMAVVSDTGDSGTKIRTTSMGADSFDFGTGAGETDEIVSLNADGFTAGLEINANGVTYYYFCILATSNFHVGTYTGNNTDDRSLPASAMSFDPDLVSIKADVAQLACWKVTALAGDATLRYGSGAADTDKIQSLTIAAGKFQVGTHDEVNDSALDYFFFAAKSGITTDLKVGQGTYTGDGTASKAITGLGFTPKVVFVKADDATANDSNAVYRIGGGGAEGDGSSAGFGRRLRVGSDGKIWAYGGTGSGRPLILYFQSPGGPAGGIASVYGGELATDLPAANALCAIVDVADKEDGGGLVIILENYDAYNSGVRPIYHCVTPFSPLGWQRATGLDAGVTLAGRYVVPDNLPGYFHAAFADRDIWHSPLADGSGTKGVDWYVTANVMPVVTTDVIPNRCIWLREDAEGLRTSGTYLIAAQNTGATVGIYKSYDSLQTVGLFRPATGFATWPASALGKDLAVGPADTGGIAARLLVAGDRVADSSEFVAWRIGSGWTNAALTAALERNFAKVRPISDVTWFVFAFGGESNIDVGEAWRTKDGGTTWDQPYVVPDTGRVWQDIQRAADGRLWGLSADSADDDHMEIYYNDDPEGDGSWTESKDDNPVAQLVCHLMCHPTNPNIIAVWGRFSADNRDFVIWYTTDRGATWTSTTVADLSRGTGVHVLSPVMLNTIPGRIVILHWSLGGGDGDAEILTSDDYGATWDSRKTFVGVNAGSSDNIWGPTGDNFGNKLFVMIRDGTTIELWRSVDFGNSWTQINTPPRSGTANYYEGGLAYHAATDSLYLYGDSVVIRLSPTDGSGTFTDITSTLISGVASGIVLDPSSRGIGVIPQS